MATETIVTPAPTDEILISDESKVVDETLLNQYLEELRVSIPEAIRLRKETDNLNETVAYSRMRIRTCVFLADEMPDWGGESQTYKQLVNRAERKFADGFSDDEYETLGSSVRSWFKRKVRDAVILEWVRENRTGCKTAALDSPKLKAAMREQYGRIKSVKTPDHWLDTPPPGTTPDAAATIETPAQKVNAAAVALTEMSGVERIAHVHKLLTAACSPMVQPNAEIPGGRTNTGEIVRKLELYANAVAEYLLNGNLTGDAVAEVMSRIEKYAYQD